jgi:hypothetical protein
MSGKTMTAVLAAMTAACLLVMGVLAASGVRAEENCSLAADIVKELAGPKYGEKPAFIGTLNTPRGPVPSWPSSMRKPAHGRCWRGPCRISAASWAPDGISNGPRNL